jgi:hypothetical protein
LAHDVPGRLTAAEGRRFAFTLAIAFLGLAGVLLWRAHSSLATIAASLGAMLLVAAAAIPERLGPVYSAWMRFALAISKITTPVLMAVVYFLVITPIGLIRRAAGKSPIVTRSGNSRWAARGADPRSDLNRQF